MVPETNTADHSQRSLLSERKMPYGRLCEHVVANDILGFLAALEARFAESNKRFKQVQSKLSAAIEENQASPFLISKDAFQAVIFWIGAI